MKQQGKLTAKWKLRSDRVWIFSIQVFFIGMLIAPTALQYQRGIFLIALVFVALFMSFIRWQIRLDIFLLWLMTILIGSFGVLWGTINDAPGALRVSSVYVIWPTLYVLFIGLGHGLWVIRRLESALIVGITLSLFIALIVIFSGKFGFAKIIFKYIIFLNPGFGYHNGLTEFRISNLTTVMYGFPFLIALLFSRHRELTILQKSWLWFLVALMLIVAAGSGRRAFWVLVLISPLIALIFVQFSSLQLGTGTLICLLSKLGLIGISAAIVIFFALNLEPFALFDEFAAAFLGREESSAARYEQAVSLWRAFESSPLIGIGLGSATDILRSEEQPWAFELTYLSLLKSVGLVGFGIYLLAVFWVLLEGMVLAMRDRKFAALFVPMGTALVCFLVITATNPYLTKFDYLWVLFLPVAAINAQLTKMDMND